MTHTSPNLNDQSVGAADLSSSVEALTDDPDEAADSPGADAAFAKAFRQIVLGRQLRSDPTPKNRVRSRCQSHFSWTDRLVLARGVLGTSALR